ncbi:noncanonical pyrimidine nucleotidase, YjjG family [Eggerthia catenaformis]|nr:noncanonical pyrimidine nucleotidase, YjjG family [Eggerthia catenaformis]
MKILWDIDGTLLDFKKSEYVSLKTLLKENNISLTDDLLSEYLIINKKYWKNIENGRIERTRALEDRFKDFFQFINRQDINCQAFNYQYQKSLSKNTFLEKHALNTLALCQNHEQYVVTNGSKIAQQGKLESTGIQLFIKQSFISEEVGYEKPHISFFDYVKKMTDYDCNQTIIIGDSLTSDIKGGINADILTCWYNPEGILNETDIIPDYQIGSLLEVKQIVG